MAFLGARKPLSSISNEKLISGVGVLKDSQSILAPFFVSSIDTAAFSPSIRGALPIPTTCFVRSPLVFAKDEITETVPPL